MKKMICIFMVMMCTIGCSEMNDYLFHDVARVQFLNSNNSSNDLVYSFVWLPTEQLRDTIYLPIQVLGGPLDAERYLRVLQVDEYNITYEYDNKGYVVDSTVVAIENKAQPGIHYVSFDDPGVVRLLRVKPNQVIDSLPIILLRDQSLKNGKVILKVQLETSKDFQLGESNFLTRRIVFSDKLEKPTSWNFWTKRALGEYSLVKHELIIKVLRNVYGDNYVVDDKWFEIGNGDNAFFVYWRGKFIEALNEFNENPENIALGKAPLREDPNNPNSKVVTFPTRI